MDVINASVAIVDEDRSPAARTIRESTAAAAVPAGDRQVRFSDINRVMDTGKYTFVVDIPPRFQQDLEANAQPEVQIITDATAMSQAGRGPRTSRRSSPVLSRLVGRQQPQRPIAGPTRCG